MIESEICTAGTSSEMEAWTMDKRAQTVCFTGHRTIRVQDFMLKNNLKQILIDLIEHGYRYFGAGGARGFDMAAADMVLSLREKYPQTELILVLPFVNQYSHETGWSEQEMERYQELKAQAQDVIHLQETYSRGCYYRRNRYLVNLSSVCVCYQYKNSGGTAYTTKYAAERGLKIINCISAL